LDKQIKNKSCLNAHYRAETLDGFTKRQYDLLVIGGGITGAGIALDAASRGISVALIEMQDFAGGTSSRSTKLIHGGLRYLKQFEFGLVMQTGRERNIALKNAPHLVIPERLILPLVKGGSFGKLSTSFGLWLYDLLAGVKKEERRKMLSKKEVIKMEPLINQKGLIGGGIYTEYRTDDARLTMEVLKTAVGFGAEVINYVKADDFIYEQGKLAGIKCTDKLAEKALSIKAKAIVNACGPWVDTIRKKDNSLKGKRLHLTKGVHIVVPHHRLPINNSIYFDVDDGRMIFSIPRAEITYIGTTDTNYNGNIKEPIASKEDCQYLISAINNMFPESHLQKNDIISSWAGLRPLIHEDNKSPSELSRKDEIFISESGLFSIAGGKLTAYRKMAERAVNEINSLHKFTDIKSRTSDIRLCGGGSSSDEIDIIKEEISIKLKSISLEKQSLSLWQRYGINALGIVEKIIPLENESPLLSLARSELNYCIKEESVYRLLDFLLVRTGFINFEPSNIEDLLEGLASQVKSELKLSETQINEQISEVRNYLKNIITFK